MKYYLIAGEASGDLQASYLMKGLMEKDEGCEFRFFGGDQMAARGGTLVRHYKDTAVMGLFRVIFNLRKIRANFKFCRSDIRSYAPDVLILVDYAGFNLRMARFAKKSGLRVIYYISPKVWAWNKSRIKDIKRYVDRMFVILPFEVDFYKDYGFRTEFVGNPLIDALDEKTGEKENFNSFCKKNSLPSKPIIAFLAGSRKEEVQRCLPEMMQVIPDFPEYQFVIAGAPGLDPGFYSSVIGRKEPGIVYNQTYELLVQSTAAVVTSGTATLETALLGIPEVVCYKPGRLTYHLGKHLVKIKFFSLVNLIMDREVVKEYLYYDLAGNIRLELGRILNNTDYRNAMTDEFGKLREKLGGNGAYLRLADGIMKFLSE